jgi:hypothetical protein
MKQESDLDHAFQRGGSQMKAARWLVPFTFGVNMRAVDLVLHMAEQCGATLIVASLIVVPEVRPEQKSQGPRLEYIQQSKDFLEAVRWKAAQYQVAIESYEVWTADIHEQMKRLTLDLRCDSIVVVPNSQQDILLDAREMKRLLTSNMSASLLLVHMPASEPGAIACLSRRLFSLIRIFFHFCKEGITCLEHGSY